MTNCIFCKIARGEIPSEIVYNDDRILGFRDINPAAPTHILFIPKEHHANLNDMKDLDIIARIVKAARDTASKEGIAESGYRIVINNNANAGQEVFHIHVHLIGGKRLGKMA